MANKKYIESVEDKAFQALDEALQIDFSDEDLESRSSPTPDAPERKLSEPTKQTRSDAAPKTGTARNSTTTAATPRPAEAPKSPNLAAANDANRASPASILKALDGGSQSHAVRNATIFSLFWIIGGVGLAMLLYGTQIRNIQSVADLAALPGVIACIVGIVVPVLLFYAFGMMISRAHDMRNAARSMAEVALRLVEPETVASDRIMTVGQAVRREVSAMNEGIERTIARATELETLVHTEVNALERSYADNELRVRGLVHELGAERDAIVNHAERIRSSIVGVHDQIKEDLSLATEEIAVRLSTSGEAFASMIDTRAAALMEKSDSAVNAIGTLLAAKTDSLLQNLNASGFALSSRGTQAHRCQRFLCV